MFIQNPDGSGQHHKQLGQQQQDRDEDGRGHEQRAHEDPGRQAQLRVHLGKHKVRIQPIELNSSYEPSQSL